MRYFIAVKVVVLQGAKGIEHRAEGIEQRVTKI
jgi:hypothetical protein